MSLLRGWTHENWPHWFPKKCKEAKEVFGLNPPAASKENNIWRIDLRETFLKKYPKNNVSTKWKLQEKKTVYLRKYKYNLRLKQQQQLQTAKKKKNKNIFIKTKDLITESDLENDDKDYKLSLEQLKKLVDTDSDEEETLWEKYFKCASEDETNETKLSTIGAVGLNWNLLFEKKLAPKYKIDDEDLKKKYRRETWLELFERKMYETGWEIWKSSHYSCADMEIQKHIEYMMKTAKLEAFNRFVINADPHCWECLICNPVGIYLIQTSFKVNNKNKRNKKRRHKKRNRNRNKNRNRNNYQIADDKQEVYGKVHPTLNDFGLRTNSSGI